MRAEGVLSVQQSNATIPDIERSLYEKRTKIYPREVHGTYAWIRNVTAAMLLGGYYLLPWLSWDGRPLILFDLPARKFYLFGATFWPQDFIYLACLLVIAALSLFFVTALAGRVWCGYACPQTVWTEVFLAIEHALEGDRSQQMKLDAGPWSLHKWRVKVTKHIVWLVFAFGTGFTFVAYFAPVDELAARMISLRLGGWETFWLIFYSLATYGNAGWLREQVCKYMCPYARFQSAMFDRDTFIIAYDAERGEPRGSRKRGTVPSALGLGDCLDCTLCTQVCPTGIDIRRGLQYECIGCAACVDVCDDVMAKMDYRQGLIRYVTENALHGAPGKLLRPRVLAYGLMLTVLILATLTALVRRVPLEMDLMRDRNQLYRELAGGMIENIYTMRIINKDRLSHHYQLSVDGITDVSADTDPTPISVDAESVGDFTVRLRAKDTALETRSAVVTFRLTAAGDSTLTADEQTRFLGPAPAPQ